jgi:hypothetical protein
MTGRLEPRVVDPSRCWVRHVRRTQAGEVAVATIGAASFTPQPLDALGGRAGWQTASIEAGLNGDGTLTIRFPNAPGEDGVLHRRRFALLTDPAYRVGEEWLELYREPYTVEAVCTPAKWRRDRQVVELTCVDVSVHLATFRGSELDVWDGHAPRDVIEHYTRARTLVAGTEFAGFAPAAGAWGAWTVPAAVTVGPTGRPRITAGGAWQTMTLPLADVTADCWTVELRARVLARTSPAYLALNLGGGVVLQLNGMGDSPSSVDVTAAAPGVTAELARALGFDVPRAVNLRVVARYDRLFYFVNGELVAELRRPAPYTAPTNVAPAAFNATVELDAVHVEDLTPYALRGADKGDRMLAGSPPPVGLRARYYNAAGIYANNAARDDQHARLFRLDAEPIVERLDATLTLTGTAPNLPGAFAARWVGAIYLDLAAGDRRVRLNPVGGYARLYVGRTMRDEPAASSWQGAAGTAPLTSPALRSWLGTSEAGWFPIVVELTQGTNALSLGLQDGPADGSAYADVPSTRLSPVGVVEEQWRHEAHRTVIDSIVETFGLQWRTEPRALESGEFPGQVIPRRRVGRDTDVVIDDLAGVDVQSEGDASEAIDSLIADAAGIADPKGSGQLSAELLDLDNAAAHLGIATGYESLSEVSEAQMLETRLGSLLALRSSPNEQVGVRPQGQQDLVDSFPLTGQLALMRWRPGDGVRLELDDVDVIDRTPRQMTGVTRTYVPSGITAPTVAFRERPRDARAILKRTLRAVYALGRNYQGTLAILSGGYVPTSLAAAGNGTVYSYVPLPQDLDRLVGVYVDVGYVSTGQVTLEVNGVNTGVIVNAPGRYDVTRWAKPEGAATLRRAYARPIAASVALAVEIQTNAVLRI